MITAIALVALALAAFCSVIAWSLPGAPNAGVAPLVATALGLIGMAVGTVSLRARPASLGVVRWFVYAAATAVILQVAFGGRFTLAPFLLRLGAALGLAGLALPARAGLEPVLHATPIRVLDLLVGSLLILVIGSELGLRIFSWIAPSPLFERPATSPADRVEMHRLTPGAIRFGFPVSADGFYDDAIAVEGDVRSIALVGGDAGIGIVPHATHYTTVAENALSDTVVWNAGVGGSGPPEYLHLLEDAVLPRSPDLAIVAIEVADDFADSRGFGRRAPVEDALASWLDPRNVMLVVLPGRIRALIEERQALGRDRRQEEFGESERIRDDEALRARYPWVDDPSLEEPSFSEEVWRDRVREQATIASAADPGADLFDALDACHAACARRDVPFALLLLPAVWQVDDAEWRQIAGALPPGARDRPQELIRDWAVRRGVPVLDVLPFLRATPPQADGSRHLFHRRDDRLNARGNRLVGKALADFVRRSTTDRGRPR